MKIISWNVNGVRSWYKKGSLDWVLAQSPDFICLQEMKAHEDQLPTELRPIPGYVLYMDHSKLKKGYSGVAVYIRIGYGVSKVDTEIHVDNPSILKSVLKNGTNAPSTGIDHEGRFMAVYFENKVLINCYFPNGGGEPERLQYKLNFYDAFLKYVTELDSKGLEVIVCGDVNVAHTEIDIARPKENKDRVGFLPIERAWVDKLIDNGFVDVFRYSNPHELHAYTWWDLKTYARDRNIGWRIDYFFINKKYVNQVKEISIHQDVLGSDHCPLSLLLKK